MTRPSAANVRQNKQGAEIKGSYDDERTGIVRMPSASAVEPGKCERLYTANKAEQR
ncbi:uncharacterized protein TRAVEDRAFT_29669 [Trametes versicolor FP-101664 SS1]|uniref:uncharacterized protein n=1 Tax=Trametes versicolor (strain FP-101664) TaxID=717944 RepID=UPI0004621F3B|nr:uncharacterized protein TRAVEDRAFT_29669 [Trametes versicolor FP-101664 SS1]EIW57645.1 hypothetical protein TRAVEDRAFT_29669 [Trametes versicolor FP-101664 SS1]